MKQYKRTKPIAYGVSDIAASLVIVGLLVYVGYVSLSALGTYIDYFTKG